MRPVSANRTEDLPGGRWGVGLRKFFAGLPLLFIYSFKLCSAFSHGQPSQQLPSSCWRWLLDVSHNLVFRSSTVFKQGRSMTTSTIQPTTTVLRRSQVRWSCCWNISKHSTKYLWHVRVAEESGTTSSEIVNLREYDLVGSCGRSSPCCCDESLNSSVTMSHRSLQSPIIIIIITIIRHQ